MSLFEQIARFSLKNHRFQECYNLKKVKEIKRVQVKVETYLEPKQASAIEFFCEYT